MEEIPGAVRSVCEELERAGYTAHMVGGCVRDLLRGQMPHDWDVTTDALPDEVMTLFPGESFPTGLRHGTVTVKRMGEPVEITTYRVDGAYSDGRHPTQVTFTRSLSEDLRRRDFTVNAMAMDLRGRITDLYGGQVDLERGILRCVGDPDERFGEDALRLLRGLRFASVLGYAVEEETAAAIHRNKELLRQIAPERIRVEMDRLLRGAGSAEILLAYPDVLCVFLPEVASAVGFDQRNLHHCYTVWEHIARSVAAVPPETVLRWTMVVFTLGEICAAIQVGAFISNRAPQDCLGRINAFSTLMRGSSTALGPLLMGQLLMMWDYPAGWLMTAGIALAAAAGFALLDRRDQPAG